MRYCHMILLLLTSAVFLGCQQETSSDHMKVVPPEGSTPEETFEEMRAAASSRDWPKLYGCLTKQARRELIATFVIDIAVGAYRAEHDEEFVAVDPNRRRLLTEPQMKRAQEFFRIAKKHGFSDKDLSSSGAPDGSFEKKRQFYGRDASCIEAADEFVSDAWDLFYTNGDSIFESNAYLSDFQISNEYAVAKVNDFHSRYSVDEYCYIHFKKVDGRWLVDLTPWWSPWGPPMHLTR